MQLTRRLFSTTDRKYGHARRRPGISPGLLVLAGMLLTTALWGAGLPAVTHAEVPLRVVTTPAGELQRVEPVVFEGELHGAKELSAVALVGKLLVLGSDEMGHVQVLQQEADRYRVVSDVVLNHEGKKVDIEAIAAEGNTVVLIGSHNRTREKVDSDHSEAENQERMAVTKEHHARHKLYRFTLDAEGHASPPQGSTLDPFLQANAVLSPFVALPCKENGIDIEGLAMRGDWLYAGFRGPVLLDGYVPVAKFRWADPVTRAHLLYVTLQGRGIRDLAAVQEGFLILAGPVGDGPGSYQLYFWNGHDCLPGEREGEPAGRVTLLCEVPVEAGAKAEGLAVLSETTSAYDLLLVYDGLERGGATHYRLAKP